MICKWTNNSVFSLIAITSIIVVTVTAFYILSLNVQVIPLYFAMTRIENNKNRNVWEEFQKQWFRMLRARIDWKSLLIPCAHANFVKNKSLIGYGKRNEERDDREKFRGIYEDSTSRTILTNIHSYKNRRWFKQNNWW